MPNPRRISDIKPLFTNLAQTSHYEVVFGLPPKLLSYLQKRGVDYEFITRDAGLLCCSAQLPTTSFATSDITHNFMGVSEKFAHTRIYSPVTLEFYVDKSYKTIKFLEHWMEFISSGSHNSMGITNEQSPIDLNSTNYFMRMQYPEYYKSYATRILKFERDYRKPLEYKFYGMFPLNLSSIQVGYDGSAILKASATFQFDRYIAGSANSLEKYQGTSNNKESSTASINNNSQTLGDQSNNANDQLIYSNTIAQNSQVGTGLLSNVEKNNSTAFTQTEWNRTV